MGPRARPGVHALGRSSPSGFWSCPMYIARLNRARCAMHATQEGDGATLLHLSKMNGPGALASTTTRASPPTTTSSPATSRGMGSPPVSMPGEYPRPPTSGVLHHRSPGQRCSTRSRWAAGRAAAAMDGARRTPPSSVFRRARRRRQGRACLRRGARARWRVMAVRAWPRLSAQFFLDQSPRWCVEVQPLRGAGLNGTVVGRGPVTHVVSLGTRVDRNCSSTTATAGAGRRLAELQPLLAARWAPRPPHPLVTSGQLVFRHRWRQIVHIPPSRPGRNQFDMSDHSLCSTLIELIWALASHPRACRLMGRCPSDRVQESRARFCDLDCSATATSGWRMRGMIGR